MSPPSPSLSGDSLSVSDVLPLLPWECLAECGLKAVGEVAMKPAKMGGGW